MKTEYCFFTNKGGRPVNEDFSGNVSCNGTDCFILCDGLGGHGMGEKASRFVVNFIKNYFLSCRSPEEFTADVVDMTQKALRRKQAELGLTDKMKTTCVILLLSGNSGIVIHVGDSRLYRFRDNSIISRTRDHSIPQMLFLTGEISENEIRSHPDRNKVLRAFGDDHEKLKYDISHFDVLPGDAFLLCSDGFWEPVTEEEMTATLRESRNIKKWLSSMAILAKANSTEKAMDNYTAIAVTVKG